MAGVSACCAGKKMRLKVRRIGGKNGREIKDYLEKVYHRRDSEAQGYGYRFGLIEA